MARLDEERMKRVADLVEQLGDMPESQSRGTAQALMEAILELHGVGIDRMMEIVFDSGDGGKALIRRFAGDRLVSSLLVLHGLHPDDIETRVYQALGKIENAELLGIFEGNVRVRVNGGGCGLKTTVEAAIREAAPDAGEIVIEEVPVIDGFVPVDSILAAAARGV